MHHIDHNTMCMLQCMCAMDKSMSAASLGLNFLQPLICRKTTTVGKVNSNLCCARSHPCLQSSIYAETVCDWLLANAAGFGHARIIK